VLELAGLFLVLAVGVFLLHVLLAALGFAFKLALLPLKLVFGLVGGILSFLVVLPLLLLVFPVALALGICGLVVGCLFFCVVGFFAAAAA